MARLTYRRTARELSLVTVPQIKTLFNPKRALGDRRAFRPFYGYPRQDTGRVRLMVSRRRALMADRELIRLRSRTLTGGPVTAAKEP